MQVYLVEDQGNSPGKIYAVLEGEVDANRFAESVELEEETVCGVVPRTLFFGQPPSPGYCQ